MSAYRIIFTNDFEDEVCFEIERTPVGYMKVVWDEELYSEEFNKAIRDYLNQGDNEDVLRDILLAQYSDNVFDNLNEE